MNCSDAKHLIHLDVGGDLRTDEEQQLAGHLQHCAECQSWHAEMLGAMKTLLLLRDSATCEEELSRASVWPAVSREISRRRATPAASRRFNLKVAALSVCSLSLAVVTIVQSLSSMRESASASVSGFIPASPVFVRPQEPRQFDDSSIPPVDFNRRFPSPPQQRTRVLDPQSF
jgi:anti-sigma factor RsiW